MLQYDGKKYYIDSSVMIEKIKSNECFQPHTHDFIELVYVRSGKCIHCINETEYPCGRGDMLLINYHQTHSITCGGPIEYVNILIKPEFIDEALRGSENAFALLQLSDFDALEQMVDESNCLVHFDAAERAWLEGHIDLLCDEQKRQDAGSALAIKSGLNMLLIKMFRKMSLPIRHFSGINDELLGYIRDHLDLPLTLERLASRCGYNPSYFSRLFKHYTGRTLTEYLAACRMEYACRLLRDTDQSVERIIAQTGFSNRTKFFREFAAVTGMTPLSYRKKQKNT